MKRYTLTLISILCIQLIGGLSFAGDLQQSNILEILYNIENHNSVHIEIPTTYFGSEEFRTIYNNSPRYLPEVLEALADPNVNENQKLIAAYSMTMLPLKLRIHFTRELIKLRDKELIDYWVWDAGTFPMHDFSIIIPENYKNEELRSLLIEIRAKEWIDEDSIRYINKVLSGQMYYHVLWMKISLV